MVKYIAEIVEGISSYRYSEFIPEAFSTETLPCRYQKVSSKILKEGKSKIGKVILDMGHNSQSIERVLEKIKLEFKSSKIGVIFTGNKMKDCETSMKILTQKSDLVYLTFISSQKER